MNLLQKTLTLKKSELIELLEVVKEGKNKNNRWNLFSKSSVKKSIEDGGFTITKTEFLRAGGLESITRDFISWNKEDFRNKTKEFKLQIHKGIEFYEGEEYANTSVTTITSNETKLIECGDCGKMISKKASMCPGCGSPNTNLSSNQVSKKYEVELKKKDIAGNWCPNCGNRNSYKTSSGGGCLIIGILFISIIGILLIPFLPKSWKCKSCGNEWK